MHMAMADLFRHDDDSNDNKEDDADKGKPETSVLSRATIEDRGIGTGAKFRTAVDGAAAEAEKQALAEAGIVAAAGGAPNNPPPASPEGKGEPASGSPYRLMAIL